MEKKPGTAIEVRELKPEDDVVQYWAYYTLKQYVKNGMVKPEEVWKYQEKLEQ